MPKSFLFTHKRYEYEGQVKVEEDEDNPLQDLSRPRDSCGSSSNSTFSSGACSGSGSDDEFPVKVDKEKSKMALKLFHPVTPKKRKYYGAIPFDEFRPPQIKEEPFKSLIVPEFKGYYKENGCFHSPSQPSSSYQIKLISPPPGGTLSHLRRDLSSSPLQFIIAAAEHQEHAEEAFIEGSRSEECQPNQEEDQPVNLSVKKVDLFNLTQLAEVSIAAAKRELSLRSTNVSRSPSSFGEIGQDECSSEPKTNEMGISGAAKNDTKKTESNKRDDKKKKKEGKNSVTILPPHNNHQPMPKSNSEGNSVPSSSNNSARHRCIECGKGFSTLSNLARHRQTHRSLSDASAVKKCPHCDKVYVSMPAFSMHLRTHNQGCKCPYCGKGFSRPWLLQGHIRTHTGEKPFKCNICSKAFADKSNLRAHTQTHSTEKPFVCARCGKPFALKSYLCKHIESSCMKSNRPSGPTIGSGNASSTTTPAINNSSPISCSTGGSSPTNRDIRCAKDTTTVIASSPTRVVTKQTAITTTLSPFSSHNTNKPFHKTLKACENKKNNERIVSASTFFVPGPTPHTTPSKLRKMEVKS